MSDAKKNWITVTESRYPWERDALEFVRDRFPDHEPYRAWANFEFIALDGSINEVDLLLLTPMGIFLVEIKSRPGRVYGDPGKEFLLLERDAVATVCDRHRYYAGPIVHADRHRGVWR